MLIQRKYITKYGKAKKITNYLLFWVSSSRNNQANNFSYLSNGLSWTQLQFFLQSECLITLFHQLWSFSKFTYSHDVIWKMSLVVYLKSLYCFGYVIKTNFSYKHKRNFFECLSRVWRTSLSIISGYELYLKFFLFRCHT